MAKKIRRKLISIDALQVKQGANLFYVLALPASVLFRITEINQRSEDKTEGYQRALSLSRVKNIARYIKSGGLLPGSIVATFEKGSYDEAARKLKISDISKAGWIIDGQHRLAGAHEASKNGGTDILLPLIAFLDLSADKQIELFITINREAKGVPASLYIDLLKELPKKKSLKELTDERIADIARGLDRDELSPFHQRIIFTTTASAGDISLNNFARVLRPHVARPNGVISLFNPTEQEGAINNYYRALMATFPSAFKKPPSIFFRTVGFGAAFRAFPLVFSYTNTMYKSFSVASICKVLAEVSDYDFENWTQMGSGSGAEISAGDDFSAAIEDALTKSGASTKLKLD